jgi:hypothetical protein
MRDNARTLLGQIKEQRAPFSRADAEAIGAPTLLMAGERSPENFHRILDGLQTALKDVRRAVIPAASHALRWRPPAKSCWRPTLPTRFQPAHKGSAKRGVSVVGPGAGGRAAATVLPAATGTVSVRTLTRTRRAMRCIERMLHRSPVRPAWPHPKPRRSATMPATKAPHGTASAPC